MTALPRIAPISRAAITTATAVLSQCARAEAIAELEQEEAERERRRILRAPRGASPGRLRCGGCRRWLASANAHCACGFVNDVRGRRNVGGYA